MSRSSHPPGTSPPRSKGKHRYNCKRLDRLPLGEQRDELLPRVLGYYTRLCALPRRTRRALVRQWRRSLSAIALLLALGQAPALAATIGVAPGIPPDINADGRCALIEAIGNANADAQTHTDCVAGNKADTIVLPTGSTQSLTAVDNSTLGPTGLPLITSTVTIQGRNSTIQRESGAPAFRILAVASSGDLTLHSTTVSGGNSLSLGGGGVYNSGKLTLTNSTVSGNEAYDRGGGVANTGTLTLTNSTVSGNSAYFGGVGGVSNTGTLTLTNSTVSDNGLSCVGEPGCFGTGGVANTGTLTLANSTVSGNSGGTGGGVSNSGILTLTNSTVSGNSIDSHYPGSGGGGVSNGGTLTLANSTVSGNSAYYGGGVYNGGTLTLTNSTVSGNSGATGSGVLNSGKLTLTNSTVSGNFGANRGGVYNGGTLTLTNSSVSGNSGGGGIRNQGTLTLARTLISGNKDFYGGANEVAGSGIIIVNNHNLFGHDGDAGVAGFSPGPPDIVPIERLRAILKPLADNGGPTKTHALPVGSPAIGQSPANRGCKPTDQRGVTRPQGAACDIGAFEKGPPVRCGGQLARILGTVGNDRLIGTPGPDVIHGLAGNDIIDGLAGNDIICGGTGNDKLFGASGADALNGGSGTDICNGGSGTDTGVSCETEISIP